MKNISEKTIEAFLFNDRIVDICKASGLGKDTVRKYMKDADFQKILNDRRLEFVNNAKNKMQANLDHCIDELLSIINDKEIAPQIKINAIQLFMNQCNRWTESIDVLAKIKEFEEEYEPYLVGNRTQKGVQDE